jgi:hypothetical protein
VTIVRVGTTKKYSEGWGAAFGKERPKVQAGKPAKAAAKKKVAKASSKKKAAKGKKKK